MTGGRGASSANAYEPAVQMPSPNQPVRMLFAEQDMWSLSVSAWAAVIAFAVVRRLTGGALW